MGPGLGRVWVKIRDECKKNWLVILKFWEKLLGMKCAYTKVYRIGRIYGHEEEPRVKDLQRSLMGPRPESGWTMVHQIQSAIALALKRWVYSNAINVLGKSLSMSEFCICLCVIFLWETQNAKCTPECRFLLHWDMSEYTTRTQATSQASTNSLSPTWVPWATLIFPHLAWHLSLPF